jgi:hypothetical protein
MYLIKDLLQKKTIKKSALLAILDWILPLKGRIFEEFPEYRGPNGTMVRHMRLN